MRGFAPRPRKPIVERAREVVKGRLISPEEALHFCQEREFAIRDNKFTLENSFGAHPAAASVISHLGAVFDGLYVKVWLSGSYEAPVVVVNASKGNHGNSLFILGFCILSKQVLSLASIDSYHPGLGGKGVAMLYHLAKEPGVQSIRFSVNDTKAAQFYFYTDFGAPVSAESLLGNWELPVR